ncbi:hypothetical protein [Streptomyces sp. NPDC059761]|uniref:hypothetical protein n=1 Tax=Streptomyces sp. NPDC059761 TaxID=3346937 RepID=UPI00365DECF6
MSDVCGASHPDLDGVACDRAPHAMTGYHHSREAGKFWDAAPLPDGRRAGRAGLAALAARVSRTGRTGSAAEAVQAWTEGRRER